MRDDWIEAIVAAKENKPMPDIINPAVVAKNDEDPKEVLRVYFNRMLTAFGANFRSDSFQDVVLRLSSFFTRVAFLVRIPLAFSLGFLELCGPP